jgi:C1A family cysteine protease
VAYTVKRYGWLPDIPDQRDHLYAAPVANLVALPASVDLRSQCPPVYDQGQLGSCTANGIAAAVQFDRLRQNLKPEFNPSRLFIYYNERVIEHTVHTDSGAMIRDGIKSVGQQGDCPKPTGRTTSRSLRPSHRRSATRNRSNTRRSSIKAWSRTSIR